MTYSEVDIYEAARIRLNYHQVMAGEKVLVIADTGSYEPLLQAVYCAAVASQADVTLMRFNAPEQPWNWEIPPMIEQAIYNADFTFALLSSRWYYNASSQRVQSHIHTKRKRMASWEALPEAVGHFVALVPGNEAVNDRSHKIGKLLDDVRIIEITSQLGTHLVFERGNPKSQRMNNVPGQTNYSPLSIDSRLSIAQGKHPPVREVAQGILMLQGAYRTRCPGPKGYSSLIYTPVRIEIDRGRIVSIDRGTRHGAFLEDWFNSWEDPAVYYLDHLNIGVDHRVHLDYLDNLAVHYNYGGILMGFGISFSSIRGDPGVFRAHAHIELHLTGATLNFDGLPIMVNGEFTRDSGLIVPSRRPGTGSSWQEVDGHVLPEIELQKRIAESTWGSFGPKRGENSI